MTFRPRVATAWWKILGWRGELDARSPRAVIGVVVREPYSELTRASGEASSYDAVHVEAERGVVARAIAKRPTLRSSRRSPPDCCSPRD